MTVRLNEQEYYRLMRTMWETNEVTTKFGEREPIISLMNRLKVSNREIMFASKFHNNLQTLYFNKVSSNNSEVVNLTNTYGARLMVSASVGSRIVYQTKQYWHYDPGTISVSEFAILAGPPVEGIYKRVGIFDDNNGFFFEQAFDNAYLVRRSKASGVVIDYRDSQSVWNIDKLNGAGPSGLTLDWSKVQMGTIEYTWYGAGSVLYSVVSEGRKYPIHIVAAGNALSEPLTAEPDFPLRYEISSSGTPAGTGSMDIFGATIGEERGEGQQRVLYHFSISNNTGSIAVGPSRRPVLSLRPKLTFGSNDSINRANLAIQDYFISTDTTTVFYEIVYSGSLVGTNWIGVNENSRAEFDTQATQITRTVLL